MSLNPHTLLMNYVIGLCKGNKGWPSVLADLGYDVQLIEQTISLSGGDSVKTDIVKVSNKTKHALVIEIKTGSLDRDQMERYEKLTSEDLQRWITVYTKQGFSFDICIVDSDANHQIVLTRTSHPIITFTDTQISKSNNFSLKALNDALETPISLTGMMPPLTYYPFSELDEDSVIIPRILRALVSLVLKKSRGGTTLLNETVFDTDEMLSVVHPLWRTLSQQHRTELKSRIKKIISRLLKVYPKLAEHLQEFEKGKYRTRRPPERFTDLCEEIISASVVQKTLD